MVKRRIGVFTGTRAEYGILYWLLRELQDAPDIDFRLLVSGMHLSPEFGYTVRDIEADGFDIDERVEMLLSSNTATGTVKSMGIGLIGMADALARMAPDILVIVGDRFEALVAAQAALIQRISIAHIHGGEVTEGAFDDAIRHAITKMSQWHFVSTESYRRRVIQLGESPECVFRVGAPGLEHLQRSTLMDRAALESSLGFSLGETTFLMTYHPATLGGEDPAEAIDALWEACEHFPEATVVVTYPNADEGGRLIIERIERAAAHRPDRVWAVQSLGSRRYHSLLAQADLVIGNSSSGILEAPSFGVPTVDIGVRQQGRVRAESVLHAAPRVGDIVETVRRALSPEFKAIARKADNPYGGGQVAGSILERLRRVEPATTKRFFDLPVIPDV